jgi:methyl-accepting chemotaxis protein
MFIGIVIIIAYLVRRDTLRQSITDTRYDSVIKGLIEDVTKNQATYKQEIVDNVKELTLATTNVLVGVERIVVEVEKFADINTKSVAKVATNVEEVSTGVKEVSVGVGQVVTEVDRVAKEVVKVANEVTRVVCEVEKVTEGLRELSDKMSNGIKSGNITVNGKTD